MKRTEDGRQKTEDNKQTTYQKTLNWMFSKLPMYQRQGKSAFKKDLTNIFAFSKHLGYPEKKFKSIHVAGTNGKGSTSHMIASVLQEAGFKVGLYTSPHLKDFTERIRINGTEIRKNYINNFIKQNRNFLEKQQLSFFEMTVGLAFEYFAKQKVDFAIIEVGLGGRLDSTNIITPIVSVITNIGLDHTQMLGNTIEEIAVEKAGIIKNNIPVVIGEKQTKTTAIFNEIAKEKNAPIYYATKTIKKNYKTDLKGNYQKKNSVTMLKTIKILQKQGVCISENNIVKGLNNVVENTNLKGRWQILNQKPKVICDTAHNKEGLTFVLKQLLKEEYRNLHIVLGVVSDKDVYTILPMFPKKAKYYFCKPNIPRGLDEKILKEKATKYKLFGNCYHSVSQAYKKAITNTNKDDLIFIGGSIFVVAEII